MVYLPHGVSVDKIKYPCKVFKNLITNISRSRNWDITCRIVERSTTSITPLAWEDLHASISHYFVKEEKTKDLE
jgi:hypothetical protein